MSTTFAPPTAPDDYDQAEREFADPALDADISTLSDDQRSRLWQYWIDRASGELTTALAFEFILDDLRAMRVPDELSAIAEHAISDEHRHVDWCLRWAQRIDATLPARASLGGTEPLTFDGATESENRLLRVVFAGCFSETVAVHVLRASHAHITVPSVRCLNHLHMKEELGHARLGWTLLAWSGITRENRELLRRNVPDLSRITKMVWQSTRRAPDARLHAFGFLSSEIVDAAVHEALSDVIMPGLAHLGVL